MYRQFKRSSPVSAAIQTMSNHVEVLQATQTTRVAECQLRELPVFVSLYNISGTNGLQGMHTHRAGAACLSLVLLLTAGCQLVIPGIVTLQDNLYRRAVGLPMDLFCPHDASDLPSG